MSAFWRDCSTCSGRRLGCPRHRDGADAGCWDIRAQQDRTRSLLVEKSRAMLHRGDEAADVIDWLTLQIHQLGQDEIARMRHESGVRGCLADEAQLLKINTLAARGIVRALQTCTEQAPCDTCRSRTCRKGG